MNLRIAVLAALAAAALPGCGPTSTTDSPTAAPSSQTPSPSPKSGVLRLAGLDVGEEPKIAWAKGMLLNGDPAMEVFPSTLDQFAETKQLVVVRDLNGQVYAYAPGGPTNKTPIGKASGRLAMNKERNLVAWIAPDGSPTVLQEGHAKPVVLPKEDGVAGGDAVAVLGADCFDDPEKVVGAGCSVFFRSLGSEQPRSYSSTAGLVEAVDDGVLALQDADQSGSVGWNKLVGDHGSTCSVSIGGQDWKTCDHLPLSFSPDGKHVLATQPEGFEGAGAGEIAILDRATGKQLMSVRNNPESQVFIADMAWEDDEHVVATVNDGRQSAIIRVGIDGDLELAVKPVPLDDMAGSPDPLRLSVQP